MDDVASIRKIYSAVIELTVLEDEGDPIPVGRIGAINAMVEAAARGRVLAKEDLVQVRDTTNGIIEIHEWMMSRAEEAPTLATIAAPTEISYFMPRELRSSFDECGELSESRWPALASLRRAIIDLNAQIKNALESVLRDPDMQSILQDSYVTQRGNRYVIPVIAKAKRAGIGIVHDTSASGETVFIEPNHVVELNNRLKERESELQREERRILRELSEMVGEVAYEITPALAAALELDLIAARSTLGVKLRGTIPRVGNEGYISLIQSRHPVLVLKGDTVVPNSLELSPQHPGLVLTGPNAGGKTVAMKSLGLAALFVRAGIPYPADDCRIDLFTNIIADIGDNQTVDEGLSTFSSHLLFLKGAVESADNNTLALLDEIAVGTDPNQGAALAQAILEELVTLGARVATTTHYSELKTLSATDSRFRVAAVQLRDGVPTYELVTGRVGLSHAFSIAKNLGLSSAILDRAKETMSEHQRALAEELQNLQTDRDTVQRRDLELSQLEQTIKGQEEKISRREARLEERMQRVREEALITTRDRLKRAERDVVELVAALQANPNMRSANKSLGSIREIIKALEAAPEAPKPISTTPEDHISPTSVKIGDFVRLHVLGKSGEVVSVRGKRIDVRVGSTIMKVKLKDVAVGSAPKQKKQPKQQYREPKPEDLGADVRTISNTLDLRGKRYEESLEMADTFLYQMISRGVRVAFILHGHGTGALKKGIREWLPTVSVAKSWRACDDGEGGDAFTKVFLK
jgi:DNA mismatch repair protein MutS2